MYIHVSAGVCMCACWLLAHPSLLHQVGQHHNDRCVVFPHHLPEVGQCVWGGAWRGYMGEGHWIPLTVCAQHCAPTLCGNVAVGPVVALQWYRARMCSFSLGVSRVVART